MRTRLLGCLAALALGSSTVLAQEQPGTRLPPGPDPGAAAPVAVADDGSIPADVRPGDADRVWFRADYLLWWLKRSPVPVPLVTTTSDLTSQPPAALFQPGTSSVLGGQDVSSGAHSGIRLGGGGWIDDRRTIGVEANYFYLANRTVSRGVASTGDPGTPVLATPFFDADAIAESSFVLAFPGTSAGAASLTLTDRLQGAEANGVVAVVSRPGARLEILAGFRYLDLREDLTFATSSTGIQAPGDGSNNGLVLNTLDQFGTQNRFYGFQIGASGEYSFGNLTVGGSLKVGVGDMDQTTNIAGAAETNFFNAPAGGPFTGVPTQIVPGSGTFAQPSNIGGTSRHEMVVVPEAAAQVSYQFASWARAVIGYDFLYVTNVVRPGELIDHGFNAAQTVQGAVAGVAAAPGTRPAVTLTGSGFWVQGFNVAVEFRY
jgi:hypothetical protein